MSDVAVRKDGLPVDFSSPKTALKEVPVKELMEFAFRCLQEESIHYITDLQHQVLGPLFELTNKELIFGDWKYSLGSMIDYADDNLYMDFVAHHYQMECSLILSEVIEEEGKTPLVWLEIIEQMLLQANKGAEEWNQVCYNNVPIIYKRPPFEEYLEFFEKWAYEFSEGVKLPLAYLLECFCEFSELEFGDFKMYLEVFTMGNDQLMQILVDAGLQTKICVYSQMIDTSHFENAQYALNFFEYVLEKVEQNLIEWNTTIKGGC